MSAATKPSSNDAGRPNTEADSSHSQATRDDLPNKDDSSEPSDQPAVLGGENWQRLVVGGEEPRGFLAQRSFRSY